MKPGILLFLALAFSLASPAWAIREQMQCAAALFDMSTWNVPGAAYQTKVRNLYDANRRLVLIPADKGMFNYYVLTDVGDYLFTFPRPKMKISIANDQYLIVTDLPVAPYPLGLQQTMGIGSIVVNIVPPSQVPKEEENFAKWGGIVKARPTATVEEAAKAEAAFVEVFKYLWDLRENIKNPDMLANFSNAINGGSKPEAAVMERVETHCTPIFLEGPKPASVPQKSTASKSDASIKEKKK